VKRPLVLHITPHLPGGLGRILLSTLKFSENITASFAHEIVITDEKHLTVKSREMFSKYSDCLHIGKNDSFIKEKMDKADIVQNQLGKLRNVIFYGVGHLLPIGTEDVSLSLW